MSSIWTGTQTEKTNKPDYLLSLTQEKGLYKSFIHIQRSPDGQTTKPKETRTGNQVTTQKEAKSNSCHANNGQACRAWHEETDTAGDTSQEWSPKVSKKPLGLGGINGHLKAGCKPVQVRAPKLWKTNVL